VREKSRSGTSGRLFVAVTALAVAGAATVVVAGVSVLAAVMARRIVTPSVTRSDDTDVLGVDLEAATITLAVTPDSVLPGDYSF